MALQTTQSDSPLHTDGPDAVSAMAILVPKVAAYVEWAGMEINMTKSPVTAMEGSLVELVEQQPATRCVVGSIPAGSALEVWPWTSVLNSLVG